MQDKKWYQLTNPQKSIWNMEKYFEGTVINNICTPAIIYEKLDKELLEKAINNVVKKNDNFRIQIALKNGIPMQRIAEYKPFKLDFVNIKKESDLKVIESEEVSCKFNVINSSLFRFKIAVFKDDFFAIVLTVHHLIADSWGLGLVIKNILKEYHAIKHNIDLPKENSYINYINSEEDYKNSEKYKKDKLYWAETFKSIPEQASIPSFKSNKKNISANAYRKSFQLSLEMTEKINSFCKENKISVFNFLMCIYSIYISRISNLKDFVIGTPILNRSNYEEKQTIGMFINLIPVRIKINIENFIQFAKSLNSTMMGVLRHQKYSYTQILEDLRNKNTNVSNLYNILISYQITKAFDDNYGKYSTDWVFNNYCSSDFNIHITDINDSGKLLISYDYLLDKYDASDITEMHNRVIEMIFQVLENKNILVDDIEIVTKEERQKLLFDFNNTSIEYPKNKTIVDFFESKVKSIPNNVAVAFEDQKLTYKQLNEKANSLAHYLRNNCKIKPNDLVGIMVNRSIEIMVCILGIIKSGGAYVPIDPNYPRDRINYMLKTSNIKVLLTQKNLENNIAFENKIYIDLDNISLYSNHKENLPHVNKSDDLAYVIFTSGSTGLPKGTMIKHSNATNLKVAIEKFPGFSSKNAIASLATISFDMFVLESLVAALIGLKIVIASNDEQTNIKLFKEMCLKNGVDILQSTPSRMQSFMLSTNDLDFIKNAKYILVGGEPFPYGLFEKFKEITSAKIFNMYGPTETTVWSSGKELSNGDNINIGKPLANTQIYILDSNQKLVPYGISGEIYISGSGVGKGYFNNELLTKNSFIPNPFISGSIMYKTGDLGIVTHEGDIICLGRLDNQVKMRGLRIELGEIENKLNKLDYIDSCAVVKRTDENSHEFLCAYYTSKQSINSNKLKGYLEESLPRYMVPKYFIQLDVFPYTTTGKIDRKLLPLPQVDNSNKQIILPRNDIDAKLLDLLTKLLKVENISIDDSFFDIGGDSLSAINLCAEIQNNFNVQLFVRDILENPIIENLSDILSKNIGTVENQVINSISVADFYPVSSAQKRIYLSSQVAGRSSLLYNISGGIFLDGKIDIEKLENCFNALINRHESLRTYFEIQDDTVVQKILDKVDFKLDILEDANFNNLNRIFKEFVKPFDLSKAPLFRAKLVKFTNNKYIALIDMHHIISDGVSLSILADELYKLYNGDTLPELKITYKDFAAFEHKKLSSGLLDDAENYWVNQFDEIPVLDLPTNHARPSIQSFEGKKVYALIDDKTVKKLDTLSKDLNVTKYMILLSVYYILLSKYSSCEDIVIGTPVVGRDIAETNNLIGMFVNTLALKNKVDRKLAFKDFVLNIKENLLSAYKYQTYPFDELINKLNIKRETNRNPLFDTMFIYQNNIYKDEFYIPDLGISKFDLSLEAVPTKNQIKLSFEYAKDLFDEDFIVSLSNHYLNILNVALDNINIEISSISMLSKEEENKLLYTFNDTQFDYPVNKTIVDLFEEQVEKTPNNIAVIFENQQLSYKELNEKANSLAYRLKNYYHIKPNNLVGIMLNRSLEMIIGILAILKSGGAYIPIDPSYPKDRTTYMLNSSKAKLLLTQEKLMDKIVFENKLCIDLSNTEIYNLPNKNLEKVISPEDLSYVIFTSGSTGLPKGVMLKHKNIVNFIFGMMKEFNFSSKNTIASITTISFDIFVLESLVPLTNGLKVIIANEQEQTNSYLFNNLCVNNHVDIIQSTPSRINTFLTNMNNIQFLKNASFILIGGEPFPLSLLKKLTEISTGKIYNMYGPTETAVWSTLKNVTNAKFIDIGKPIINTQVYILDKNLTPTPLRNSWRNIYIWRWCM